MTAWQTFRGGWRAAVSPLGARLALLFYALYLIAAAALAAPLYALMGASPGSNAFNAPMLQGFDHLWATDFLYSNAGFFAGFRLAIVWVAILFALVQSVLSGGVIHVLAAGNRAPAAPETASTGLPVPTDWGLWAAEFGRGCGRNAAPLVRLALLGAALYYAAFAVFNVAGARAVERLTANTLDEWPRVVLSCGRGALLLIALFAINLVLDYARVRLVLEDHGQAARSLWGGARFVLAHLRGAAGAYLLWGAAALALAVLYLSASSFVVPASALTIGAWFAMAQASLCARLWLRLGFYGSAIALFASERNQVSRAVSAPASER